MNHKKTISLLISALTAISMTGTDCKAAEPISSKAYYKLDANGDGEVNSVDASLVLSEYAQVSTGHTGSFSRTIQYVADFDNDGTLNSIDASGILSTYAENSTTHEEPTITMVTFELSCTTRDDMYTRYADSYEECYGMIKEEKQKHPEGCLCVIRYNEMSYGGRYDWVIREIYRE